jgi:hypothetical protein
MMLADLSEAGFKINGSDVPSDLKNQVCVKFVLNLCDEWVYHFVFR